MEETTQSPTASPRDIEINRLVQALDRAYSHPWLLVRRSFVSGFMTAVGAWLGSVLIVVLSGLIIRHFNLVGPLFQRLEDSVSNSVIQTQNKAANQFLLPSSTPSS